MKTLPHFQLLNHRALFRGFPGSKTDGGSSTIFSAENNYPANSIKTHKWGPERGRHPTTTRHHQYNLPNLKNCLPIVHLMWCMTKCNFALKYSSAFWVAVASLPLDKKKTCQRTKQPTFATRKTTRKIDKSPADSSPDAFSATSSSCILLFESSDLC